MRNTRVLLLLSSFFILILIACGGGGDGSTTPVSDDDDGGGTGQPTGSLNNGAVGASANDLLASDTYQTLEIEIQYAAGFEPPQESIDFLKDFIAALANKPSGINVTVTEIAAPGQANYTLAELRAIEDANRTKYTEGSTIATYFFFADGDYSENANVLGVAHKNTSMVLFQKRIEELTGGLTQASTELVTSAVLSHEFGHILGLVNVGSPMQTDHQDEANGKHCDVRDCLMYFSTNTSGGLNDLVGLNAPPNLDAQCRADLTANGGK